ncbi:MAG: hypothetical protein SHS37scaffold296_20 [Burkholderiales phage 68_11]|nr:MAG: hypothetical protein SHS37scaffold296_20 [Burkholderiales phage 68_11]
MNDKEVEAAVQAKGLNAPRVTLAELKANIADTEIVKHVSKAGQVLRWGVLTTQNGFAVVGRPSVSVSPENDDEEIGNRIAVDNATNELWPLMGYALKERQASVDTGAGEQSSTASTFRTVATRCSRFTFALSQRLRINESGEECVVIGRAEYTTAINNYFVRYKAANGLAVEAWWTEDALSPA